MTGRRCSSGRHIRSCCLSFLLRGRGPGSGKPSLIRAFRAASGVLVGVTAPTSIVAAIKVARHYLLRPSSLMHEVGHHVSRVTQPRLPHNVLHGNDEVVFE